MQGGYAGPVTTQIAIRLHEQELAALDREVAEGRAASRADAVRRGIAHLERAQRYRGEEEKLLLLARQADVVYPDLEVLLDLPHPTLD
jgi:Arc/MetJ-type ribon-helix-helix transcriptional regulator